MERKVTHAAETFSVEREGRGKKPRDRDEKRKENQIKESMHFEARKGRKRYRYDHKQKGANKKQLLIHI